MVSYLDQHGEKPTGAPLAYGQRKLWLNQQEGVDFANDIRDLMGKYSGIESTTDRQAFLAGLILFPAHLPTPVDNA